MSVLFGLFMVLIELRFSEIQRSGIEFTEAVAVKFSPFGTAWTGKNEESRKSNRSFCRKLDRSKSMYKLGSSVKISGYL